MKLIRSTTPLLKQFRPTAITLAIGALMASSVLTHAGTAYDASGKASYNKLGDLTIYQASIESNKPTLTLMLDKSGSMGGSHSFTQDEEYGYNRVYRAYTRVCNRSNGCNSSQYEYTYYYYHNKSDIPSSQTYYDYLNRYTTPELTGINNQVCAMSNSSNSFYASTYNPIIESLDGIRLEHCLKGTEKVYDRMSKLKLAMIELLNFESVNEDIIMGVGAFGYDTYKGQIKVAAKPLDSAQKEKIKVFLRDLSPSGVTPMATAFTEAGAYMLGNGTYSGLYKDSYSSVYSICSGQLI